MGGIVEQSKQKTQAILSWHRTEQVDLRVEQDELRRYLILNGQQQSQMLLKQPAQPCYPHLLRLLDWLSQKPWQHFLQVGLGGGECSRAIAALYPERKMTSVEQEPLIIEVYQQFFQPVAHPHETLVCADIATFTHQALTQALAFDVIFLDIYPWPEHWQHLCEELLKLRAEKCWVCINLPGDLTDDLTGEPLALWDDFWHQQQIQLERFHIQGFRNQLWLGR
jgi:spermidine synthase